MRILVNFHPTTQKSENFFSLGEERNCLSWHWTMMQNLSKTWSCSFKNGIRNWVKVGWLEHSKVWNFALWCAIFVESILCLSQKKYRGVMCHNAEEWCKLWGGTDLCFDDMRNLGNFDPVLESLKSCTLMGSFWPKYIIFELKYYKGVMCHDTTGWCNI